MSLKKKIEYFFYPCQRKLDKLVDTHNAAVNKLEETFNNARSAVQGTRIAEKHVAKN